MAVTVDTRRIEAMFDRLVAKADDIQPVMQRAANDALDTISGIPVGATGDLAASPRVGEVTAFQAVIVSDVSYAKHVFGGTVHMDARPPHIGYDSAQLAREIANELFQ